MSTPVLFLTNPFKLREGCGSLGREVACWRVGRYSIESSRMSSSFQESLSESTRFAVLEKQQTTR